MIAAGKSLRRLVRDRRGAAAVEFGLVSIPFLILIIGGLDLAHQSYVQSIAQGALNDAARRASVEEPAFMATGDTLEARIEATIKAQVGPIAPKATYKIVERNYFEFSGIGNPEKLMTDVNHNGQFDWGDGDCFEDLNENGEYDLDAGRDGVGGANDVVLYEADIAMPRLFPFHLLTGGSPKHHFEAKTAFRNQPYSSQAVPPVVCGDAS